MQYFAILKFRVADFKYSGISDYCTLLPSNSELLIKQLLALVTMSIGILTN